MMHLELVVVESVRDAVIAGQLDVFHFEINDTECENCGMMIGPVLDEFFPCVLVQNPDDEDEEGAADTWPVCIDCAAAIIFPGEDRRDLPPREDDLGT